MGARFLIGYCSELRSALILGPSERIDRYPHTKRLLPESAPRRAVALRAFFRALHESEMKRLPPLQTGAPLRTWFLLGVLFGSAPLASARSSDLPDCHYFYGGEKRPLRLHLDQVMVQTRGAAEDARDVLHRTVDCTAIHPSAVPNWCQVELSATAENPGQLQTTMQRAIAPEQVDFASPVFLGDLGHSFHLAPEILIRLAPGASSDWLDGLPSVHSVVADAPLPGVYRLKGAWSDGFEVLALSNKLNMDSRVLWAEPEVFTRGRGSGDPNDPGFTDLWGLKNTGQFSGVPDMDMDVDAAWSITSGSPTVSVLVLDVGVQLNHPDLTVLAGVDFTTDAGNGGPVNNCDDHGTAVAGCIAATRDNGVGTVGVAPGCSVLSARVFISTAACNGAWTTSSSWTANGLSWGLAQGARVSVNSNEYGFQSNLIDDAYATTRSAGMVHFVSSGNSGAFVAYPATLADVNAVGSVDSNGNRSSFSNFGPELDFVAPGRTIYTTDRTGSDGFDASDYVFALGTSFAAPYAAATAALLLSADNTLTVDQIESLMRRTARDRGITGDDLEYGAGIINPWAALQQTLEVPRLRPNIQGAFDDAIDGDRILVGPGTYPENLSFLGKQIRLVADAGPLQTVLDGITGPVIRMSGVPSGATIEGFTITGGSANDGGGIFLIGSSPLIRDCVLGSNSAGGEGGGLYCRNGSPTIQDCYFLENDAAQGGGVFVESTNATLQRPIIERCSFRKNTAVGNGGAVACAGEVELSISNSEFFRNDSGTTGGAVNWLSGGSVEIIHSTLVRNRGTLGGGALAGTEPAQVSHCILWENRPDQILNSGGDIHGVEYSDIQQPWSGHNNQNVDPRFVDILGGDLRLQSDSPCIDVGQPSLRPMGSDLTGNLRVLDGDLDETVRLDLGAHEYTNIRMFVEGTPRPGELLRIGSTGNPTLRAYLMASLEPSEVFIPPLGYLAFDPLQPFGFLPWKFVGYESVALVPPIDPGLVYVLQMAGAANGRGNFSNVVRLTIVP